MHWIPTEGIGEHEHTNLNSMKTSPGDCKHSHSLLSVGLAGWWVWRDCRGALKRTYCYIPAPATATSPGFPVYNNRQLILLNPPSTYLWRTRHFVYRSRWIKWPISVNLCPFNAAGVYKTTYLARMDHFPDTKPHNTMQKLLFSLIATLILDYYLISFFFFYIQ